MEMHIVPFGVDIEIVKSSFGSKNDDLFNRVQQSKLYKLFDEELSFKRELYDIIFNYIPKDKRIASPKKLFGLIKGNDGRGLEGEWEDYGYALLSMCDYFGEQFVPGTAICKYSLHWRRLNQLLTANKCPYSLDRLVKSSPIFDVPYETKSINCNYFNKAEIKELLNYFNFIERIVKLEEPGISTLYYQLKDGLEFCANHNYDLVSFSYKVED